MRQRQMRKYWDVEANKPTQAALDLEAAERAKWAAEDAAEREAKRVARASAAEEVRLERSALFDTTFFCDPAAGKRAKRIAKSKCQSAIAGVAQDALGRVIVLYAWAKVATTDELIEKIFETNRSFAPDRYGVEANAMQELFADALAREARGRGERLKVVPVQQSTRVDKLWRIRSTLQPVIGAGRLVVGEEQLELRSQLEAFPLGRWLDLVDALASAVALMPKRAVLRQRDEELDSLAAYLRATGAPPSEIERRLREVAAQRSA